MFGGSVHGKIHGYSNQPNSMDVSCDLLLIGALPPSFSLVGGGGDFFLLLPFFIIDFEDPDSETNRKKNTMNKCMQLSP